MKKTTSKRVEVQASELTDESGSDADDKSDSDQAVGDNMQETANKLQ